MCDGRLTWRYADWTVHVTAIEPFGDAIAKARSSGSQRRRTSGSSSGTVAFEDFAAASETDVFDVALLVLVALLEWSPRAWCMLWRGPAGVVQAGTYWSSPPGARGAPVAWRSVRTEMSRSPKKTPRSTTRTTSDVPRKRSQESSGEVIFALDDSRRFDLRTRATSVAELREYWEAADAYEPEESPPELVRLRDAMYARRKQLSRTHLEPRWCTWSQRGCLA